MLRYVSVPVCQVYLVIVFRHSLLLSLCYHGQRHGVHHLQVLPLLNICIIRLVVVGHLQEQHEAVFLVRLVHPGWHHLEFVGHLIVSTCDAAIAEDVDGHGSEAAHHFAVPLHGRRVAEGEVRIRLRHVMDGIEYLPLLLVQFVHDHRLQSQACPDEVLHGPVRLLPVPQRPDEPGTGIVFPRVVVAVRIPSLVHRPELVIPLGRDVHLIFIQHHVDDLILHVMDDGARIVERHPPALVVDVKLRIQQQLRLMQQLRYGPVRHRPRKRRDIPGRRQRIADQDIPVDGVPPLRQVTFVALHPQYLFHGVDEERLLGQLHPVLPVPVTIHPGIVSVAAIPPGLILDVARI